MMVTEPREAGEAVQALVEHAAHRHIIKISQVVGHDTCCSMAKAGNPGVEIQIPQSQRSSLKILLRLGAAERTALLDGLEAKGAELVVGGAESALAQASGLLVDEAADILDMLLGIYRLHGDQILTTSLLLKAIHADEELTSETKDDEELSSFFDRLFTLESSLGLVLKAYRLSRTHAHALYSCEVLTDLRPVFDATAATPKAAAIVHTLRMTYQKGHAIEEVFLGLETEDLKNLASTLERALNKERSLRLFAEKSSLPVLATEER